MATTNPFTYPSEFSRPSIFNPQRTAPMQRPMAPQVFRPQAPGATQTAQQPPQQLFRMENGQGNPDITVKPQFGHGGGGFLTGSDYNGPIIVRDPKGNVVEHLQPSVRGTEGNKYQSQTISSGQASAGGYTFEAGGHTYNIPQGGQRHGYNYGTADPVFTSNKGALGGGGDGSLPSTAGAPGGGSSGLGALPFDLSGRYPTFNPVSFPTIAPADYQFTDPTEFGNNFATNNRDQFGKNFSQAQDFSLQALQTELQGLQNFAPGAADLSRGETAADNASNQAARTSQVNSVLPGAAGTFDRLDKTLTGQADRASIYASGRLPNSLLDRALELGIRSRAADTAGFSGIGPNSEAAAKTSDLMSADERFQIAQYGEGLTGQNVGAQEGLVGQRANLFLAPTEYSQTGSQIKPTPEVGAGRLTYQGAGMLNESTLLSPGQALQTQVQQQQYKTGLVQSTNEFNAQGMYDASKFDSSNEFAAGLGLFNYQVGVASQVQGVNQANLNGAVQAQTGGFAAGQYDAGVSNGQAAQTIQSAAAGTGIIPSSVNAVTGALTPSTPATTGTTVGAPVGGSSNLNTTPSNVQTGQGTNFGAPTPAASSLPASSGIPVSQISRGVDTSVPQAVKFSDGVAPPAGYQSIGSNGNGTYSAVPTADYRSDLDRFAKYGGAPSGSIQAGNAAIADRNISNSTGLSYVPLPNLQQVALSGSGKPVFSTPAAAANGNTALGAQNVNGLAITAATLGALTPENAGGIGDAVRQATSATAGAVVGELDKLHSEEGPEAVTKGILEKFGGKVSTDTAAGQQLVAGAARLGELWGGLSPAQKSLGISSLAAANIAHKTGEHLGDRNVPGSEKTAGGALKIGDAAALTGQGLNGHALARNWGQLTALAASAGLNTKDRAGLARTMDSIGMLGFGPQGASVPIDAAHLKKVGAVPAPALGVGAALFENKSDLPPHYVAVSKTPDGKTIGMPENTAHTSSLSDKLAPLTFAQARQVSQGNHPVQKNWGPPPARGIQRGSVGGSAVVSGLHLMSKHNPTLLGSVIAHSLYNETLGTNGEEANS